jgi:hypothetical protein
MALVLKQIFTTGSDEIAQNYIIESWHVSQSVDAFTGAAAYDITISGSLTLTGSVQSRNGFTGSLLGTSSWANNTVTASYAQTSQTASYVLNAVSSSFTSTASYVLLAQSSSISAKTSIVSGVSYPSGSVKGPGSLFNFIAGADKTGGIPSQTASIQITELASKILGQTAFVTATAVSGSGPISSIQVSGSIVGNVLTFESSFPNTDFNYIIMYI